MTDDIRIRQQAIASIIKGVAMKTSLIVLGAVAAASVYGLIQHPPQGWWFLPFSILFGAGLGLLNFRWLASSVGKIYLRPGATPGISSLAALIISGLKLTAIFVILFIVIRWQLVHIFGLVGGLSLCFLAILWEGVTLMKHTLKREE
jgi:hypothetical protein